MNWPYLVAIYVLGAVVLGTWYIRKLERDDDFRAAYGSSFEGFEARAQRLGLRQGTATKWVLFSTLLWWPLLLVVGLLWSLGLGRGRK